MLIWKGLSRKNSRFTIAKIINRNASSLNILRKAGIVSPTRSVPQHIVRPNYVLYPDLKKSEEEEYTNFAIHDAEGIKNMRKSCRLAKKVLTYCGSLVKPGITTDEIDALGHEMMIREGAYPSTLFYNGFPKSLCTSINNVVCHGIPDDRPLQDGDIVNIDVSVYIDGYHGDCSETFLVGNVDEKHKLLVDTARLCRDTAISLCGPEVDFRVIGSSISSILRQRGYSTPQDLVGHGIGRDFHQAPFIVHCDNEYSYPMKTGMTFTIEPVICEGSPEFYEWDDKWTLSTKDEGFTAQFEHTILITEKGHEILTTYTGD